MRNQDFGVSFFGSMNGFLTAIALRKPAGVSISISVPSFVNGIGNQAYHILLEARRHRERGQGSDLLAVLPDRPRMRKPGPDDLVTWDLDTDELPLGTLLLNLSQRGSADEVVFLVQVDEPSQTGFVRVVIPIDVRRIVQDPGLDPPVLGGTGGP